MNTFRSFSLIISVMKCNVMKVIIKEKDRNVEKYPIFKECERGETPRLTLLNSTSRIIIQFLLITVLPSMLFYPCL